jgi:hypothetical protein
VGSGALAWDGFSGGRNAKTGLSASNSVQLGTGTNSDNLTIQFLSGGSVDATEWGALANSTSIGRELMQAPTNGTDGQILIWTNNDVSWVTNTATGGGSTVDLSTTNATGVLPISKGGTGTNTAGGALTNLGVMLTNQTVQLGEGANSTDNNRSVALGYNARVVSSAINDSSSSIAIGESTSISNSAAAIALSFQAAVSGADYAAQIGTGTNTSSSTIQFLSAGSVDTNEWARIAALSTYPTTNISVTGTNNTNTLVFSNGILVEVQ